MAPKLTRPVPFWDALPGYVQTDLASKGVLTGDDFDELYPEYRLSVLNLYVKLSGITIAGVRAWDYIRNITRADLGVIDFMASDINILKQHLTFERTFADPWGDTWDSRELRLHYSAHFKHGKAWGSLASVHIDPYGLFTGPGVWRKLEAVATVWKHWNCYYDYKNVDDIRSGLLSEGWDPLPLTGLPASGSPAPSG